MFNVDGVTTYTYGNTRQILANAKLHNGFSIRCADTGVVAGADGKKWIKAGTPMAGSLDDLFGTTTPWTADLTGTGTNVKGVLIHDVEVTKGAGNGSLLTFGFVNKRRVDTDVAAMYTAAVATAIPMVQFVSTN